MTDNSSRKEPGYQNLSTSQLREDLRNFSEELGHPPRQDAMDQKGPHSANIYVNRFGSWRAAIEDAGFELSAIQSEDTENKDRSSSSKEFDHGKSITSPCPVQWCDEVLPSRVSRREHLHSHPPGDVRQALGRHLRELDEEIGHPPKRVEMSKYEATEFQPNTYAEWFESWTDALRFAELPPWTNRTNEDYVLALIRLSEKLERPPTKNEMDRQGQYSPEGYIKRFGSWSSSLYLAGLDKQDVSEDAWADFVEERGSAFFENHGKTDDVSNSRHCQRSVPEVLTETEKELISSLREFMMEFGEIPSPTQLDRHGPEKSHEYIERFGTWAKAVRLAKEDS